MKKTQLLVVICLATLTGGNVLAYEVSVEITITDNGFQPEELTVQPGTMVTFKNVGAKSHWPASNFHPTHTLYPEKGGCLGSKFDACRGLKTGETFSYRLDIPGTWPIHDHLHPGLTGVINVQGDASEVNLPQTKSFWQKFASFLRRIFKRSSGDSVTDFRKLNYTQQTKFIRDLSQEDPAKAWNFLKKAFVVDGQVVGSAHEMAHIIGNTIYDQQGLEGIKICDTTFAYGCYHGVTEKLFQDQGPGPVKLIQQQCLDIFPPKESQDYTGCIHGMGHGLLSWAAYDVTKALEHCDGLDQPYRPYCYDGVFMENAAYQNDFDARDPWRFCYNMKNQYHFNCARYQSQLFFTRLGNDFDAVAKLCAMANQAILRQTCLESVGHAVAQRSLGRQDLILSRCGEITNKQDEAYCLIGAAKEITFQDYPDWSAVSEKICHSIDSEKLTRQCLGGRDSVVEIYNRTK